MFFFDWRYQNNSNFISIYFKIEKKPHTQHFNIQIFYFLLHVSLISIPVSPQNFMQYIFTLENILFITLSYLPAVNIHIILKLFKNFSHEYRLCYTFFSILSYFNYYQYTIHQNNINILQQLINSICQTKML